MSAADPCEGREAVVGGLSQPDEHTARTVSAWLGTVVSRPHPQLGRDGPVCPFVQPAVRAGALSILVHHWRAPHDTARMVSVIGDIVRRFRQTEPRSPNRKLHALVVVIAGLPDRHFGLIDEGHRVAKDTVIRQGLMLGQFHPRCDEPAVRNPLFPVNRAPYPLYAVRHMAVHDILFLHHERDWFDHYRRAFGHRYSDGSRLDRHFRELYESSLRRYARPEGEFA